MSLESQAFYIFIVMLTLLVCFHRRFIKNRRAIMRNLTDSQVLIVIDPTIKFYCGINGNAQIVSTARSRMTLSPKLKNDFYRYQFAVTFLVFSFITSFIPALLILLGYLELEIITTIEYDGRQKIMFTATIFSILLNGLGLFFTPELSREYNSEKWLIDKDKKPVKTKI